MVQVLPRPFEALEAGAFLEFLSFVLHVVFGEELDLADFIVLFALGSAENGKIAPIDLMDGLFVVSPELWPPRVRVGGVDEIVD